MSMSRGDQIDQKLKELADQIDLLKKDSSAQNVSENIDDMIEELNRMEFPVVPEAEAKGRSKKYSALKRDYDQVVRSPSPVQSEEKKAGPPPLPTSRPTKKGVGDSRVDPNINVIHKSVVEEFKSKQGGGEVKNAQPPLPPLPPHAGRTPPPIPKDYQRKQTSSSEPTSPSAQSQGSQAGKQTSSSEPTSPTRPIQSVRGRRISELEREVNAKVLENQQKAAAEAERADEAEHQKARVGAGLRNESANRDREKARIAEQAAETKAAEQAVRTARAAEVGEDLGATVRSLSVIVSNCLDEIGILSKAASEDKRVGDFVKAFNDVHKELQVEIKAEVEQRNNPNPKVSPTPGIVQADKLNKWVKKVAEACDTFTNPPQGVLAKGLERWQSFRGKDPAVVHLTGRIEHLIAENDVKLGGLMEKAGVVLTHDLRQHGVTGLKGPKGGK